MKKIKRNRILLLVICTMLLMNACAEDELDENVLEDAEIETPLDENENDDSLTARRGQDQDLTDDTIDLIVDWNELWLQLDRYTTGMRPNATARALAYIHLAVYETAVFEMEGYTSNDDRLRGLNINEDRRNDIDLNLAINACYAEVLDHFMYSLSINGDDLIDDLENEYEDYLSEDLDQEVTRNSIQWGNYVAEQIIDYSQTDSDAEEQINDPQPFSYEPPTGEGYWTYSADAERAWFPYWGSVRTFVISTEETSSIPPPISYNENPSSDYYAAMYEVYEVSTTALAEDNEDLWISEFWSDDVEGYMMSPPGRQISIAIQLIEQYDLDFTSSLALLLRLGFSLNDASVSTWADKYEHMVMRPNVYIQEFIDPDYQTNLYRFINWPNPSFPGYPSGHSSFASAAAGVFINQFGDATNFTDRSHEGRTGFRSTPRQFNRFSDMAEENAFSRVPFGVHLSMDCTEGLRLGYEISEAVNNLDLESGS